MADWPRRPLWSAEKPYAKQQAPDPGVPDAGDVELTDLLLPTSSKTDAGWVGWQAGTVQVDVDLGRARWVGFCQAWMLRRDADSIGQATSLTIRGSNNAVDWTTLGSVAPALADLTAGWVEVVCTTLDEWRYVRFEVATASTWVYVGELQAYGFRVNFSSAQAGTADAGAGLQFLYHMNAASGSSEPDYSGSGRTLSPTNSPPAGAGVCGGARKSIYEAALAKMLTCSATGNIAWGTGLTWMMFIARALDASALIFRMALFCNPGYSHFGWYCGGAGQNKQWWVRLNNVDAGDVKSPAVQNIPMDTWYHLAVTYDGAAVRLYANGNLVGKKAWTGTVTTSTYLRVGGDNSAYYLPDSWIDEVLGFTRALSEEEIRHYAYRRHGRAA